MLQKQKIFPFGPQLDLWIQKKFDIKTFGIRPFFDPADPKNPIFTGVTKICLGFFPPDRFLIFQWKSINKVWGYSPLRGKFAIWAFRGQTSYLF